MNRNTLKIIACLSMLIDHAGLVLFPEITFMRTLGRIAMPIFAFFIGEGCVYTKDRKKYFLRVFILGLICQAVYIIEGIVNGSGNGLYLNILLTFSMSIALCSAFLNFKEKSQAENRKGKDITLALIVFLLTVGAIYAAGVFCDNSFALIGKRISFDYGLPGVFLPLFACLSKDKKKKLLSYAIGLFLFCVMKYPSNLSMFFFALIPLPLLMLYNGKGGSAKLKYFFYLFYPVHLVVIYLIDWVV